MTFNQVFTAVLTHQNMKQHLPFPLQLPAGVRRLSIRLDYAPARVEATNNLLTLTVLDPHGFRGAAHRHAPGETIQIGEESASPGFIPGPLPAGEWTVRVDTHLIMPGAEVKMELQAEWTDDQADAGRPPAGQAAPAAARQGRGPGWYLGDFHTHTFHSDGHWEAAGLIAYAQEKQFDFITLSDHNTVSGLAELERLCPDGLLPIFASELTTFWGHALALGLREWVDWRIQPGRREIAHIAAEVEARGGLFVIAHPEAIGDPYCTGCKWVYPEMRPGAARVVEVWNSAWISDSFNEAGLALAYQWLNSGLRLALTAGTDCHGPQAPGPGHGYNRVYAEELSQAAILKAVRQGRVVLSSGPELNLTAQAGGRRLMVGDAWPTRAGESIEISAAWDDCPAGSTLELVVDGVTRATGRGAASARWELPGGATGWALAALRGPQDELLALTNPIYFNQ